jgi:hypothetical protein
LQRVFYKQPTTGNRQLVTTTSNKQLMTDLVNGQLATNALATDNW